MDEAEADGSNGRAAAVYLMVTGAAELAYLALGIWLILPDHQRRAVRMKAAGLISRLAGKSARRAAAASAETELRTGLQLYSVPLLLSRIRDRAAAYYEGERP